MNWILKGMDLSKKALKWLITSQLVGTILFLLNMAFFIFAGSLFNLCAALALLITAVLVASVK
jgi:hypothetical protein